MRKLLLPVLAAVLIATPVLATHVSEPTSPITGTQLRVLRYSPQAFVPCDGDSFETPITAPLAPSRNLRIQPFVQMDFTQRPSEHFLASVKVEELVFGPMGGFDRLSPDWALQWAHSNVPPHGALHGGGGNVWWLTTGDNANTWLSHAGVWRVTFRVLGDESGNEFVKYCTFRVE